MMTQYGFGAKISSGFGLAENMVDNGGFSFMAEGFKALLNVIEPIPEIPEEFLKYLENGKLKEFCRNETGEPLSNTEYGKQKPKEGGSFSEFKEFKSWYKIHANALKEQLSENTTEFPIEKFKNFDELIEIRTNDLWTII